MALTAVINTAIRPSNYEIIRDRIAEILGLEFTLQKASFNLPVELCPAKIDTERFLNVDENDFPVVIVRMVKGLYLDEDGRQTKDSGGTRIGTYRFYVDVYTGSPSNANYFGDEIATKNLQRMMGIIMAILEDTRYSTLGFDPKTSGIADTHVDQFFVKNALENENVMDFVCGRVVFIVTVPEQVSLPLPRQLLMTTITTRTTGQSEVIISQLLQMPIVIASTGATLTNAFFSNPVRTLDLLDDDGTTITTYEIDFDFTIAGTTITARTFAFFTGQTYVAKT